MTQERDIIAPASLPQELFIQSDADITIASGSAGSSKSFSILLRFLRYAQVPKSRGIVFRRNTTQLEQQGGLWDEAQSLYRKIHGNKLKVNIKKRRITFPNGSSIQFSHFESEKVKEDFKGLQADFIAFDEATEFTEEQVVYLMSRNRNADVAHKGTMCMATNPHCDSFLLKWVWWWLDPITGIPDPKKRGVVRYFKRQGNGELDWYDTREEAEAVYGSDPKNGVKSMCVIGSTVYDNPFIVERDPDYIGSLESLSRVEKERLLYGSWTAREESSGYFKRTWLGNPELTPQKDAPQRVRSWDLAASIPSEVYPNPDWTVGVLMSRTKDKKYRIEHVKRFRDLHHGVERRILEQAFEDGQDVAITLPKDVGSSAQSYVKGLQAMLAEHGFKVHIVPTVKDKITRFAPFCSLAEAGFVTYCSDNFLPFEEKWNDTYLTELEQFDGSRKFKRDQVDATSDACNFLRQARTIPNFSIYSVTTSNPFQR